MSVPGARSGQQRIAELVDALESLEDPQARVCAQELVQAVLDLHGAGLARMLDIVAAVGASGQAMLAALAHDESVAALLLLHGLHPQDLASRVRQAVDGLRAELGVQGIVIDLGEVAEERVRLRLRGQWHGRKPSAAHLRSEIEAAIFALAPEVAAVEIDNLPDASVHEMKFVPASALRSDHAGNSR